MKRCHTKNDVAAAAGEAILRLARALARQAAREDHERQQASGGAPNERGVIYARFSTDLQNDDRLKISFAL